jgi:hypothetical protein
MARWLLAILGAIVLLGVVTPPHEARAEGTSATAVPVMILAFDSEDAEDQADGLTAAFKSRVRASHALTLIEGNQSLGMLTAALKCPARPTPDCQQKIADQIRQERYVWGFVSKAGPGQVQAETHLYQRGKPDTVAQEKYADNLKDGNDDALRKIAQRLLDKLSGVALAVLVVKAGNLNGEVVIDGDKRFPLKNGSARIELSPDTHAVEIAAAGATAGNKRNVLLAAGKETMVDLSPAAPASSGAGSAPASESKAFPTRKVVGGAMAAVGVGLGIFAIERFSTWSGYKDDLAAPALTSTITDTKGQAVPACEATGPSAEKACRLSDKASTAGVTGVVAGAAGGLLILGGAYFLFTSGSDKEKTAATGPGPGPRVRQVSPWVGAGTAGVGLSGQF